MQESNEKQSRNARYFLIYERRTDRLAALKPCRVLLCAGVDGIAVGERKEYIGEGQWVSYADC